MYFAAETTLYIYRASHTQVAQTEKLDKLLELRKQTASLWLLGHERF
jgi:hypothetical protein